MRTFELHRDVDVSGISGTGLVAEGVEWADGTVALRWLTEDLATTVIHRSIETVERLHCHQGSSRIEWTGSPRTGLPQFIDELRAARKVVEAARRISHSPEVVGQTEDSARRLFDLDQTIRAYDQAAGAAP